MTIQKTTIKNLLNQLGEYFYFIENMNIGSEKELLGNHDIQHLLERRLHIAIEISIDIAAHLAESHRLPGRETAKSVFEILGKRKIISKNIAEKMQKAIGFRNILVHEYGKIDHSQIFRDYKEDLNDLHQFAREVVKFLDK